MTSDSPVNSSSRLDQRH